MVKKTTGPANDAALLTVKVKDGHLLFYLGEAVRLIDLLDIIEGLVAHIGRVVIARGGSMEDVSSKVTRAVACGLANASEVEGKNE